MFGGVAGHLISPGFLAKASRGKPRAAVHRCRIVSFAI
jgi:hypothetical protein